MIDFGQPDANYEGPSSLIIAVHNYPTRFSPETHALVAELTARVVYIETPASPDSIQ